jgi:hypothetical protein
LEYKYKPETDINEVATDVVDQSEITEEDKDPITLENLKDGEVVKMNCCGTYYLKENLKTYLRIHFRRPSSSFS